MHDAEARFGNATVQISHPTEGFRHLSAQIHHPTEGFGDATERILMKISAQNIHSEYSNTTKIIVNPRLICRVIYYDSIF